MLQQIVLTARAIDGLAFLINPMLVRLTLPATADSYVIATTREFGDKLKLLEHLMTYEEVFDPGSHPKIEEMDDSKHTLTPAVVRHMPLEQAVMRDLDRRVLGVVLDRALGRGCKLSVFAYGEERLSGSTCRQRIASLLLRVRDEAARLRVRRSDGTYVGEMVFTLHGDRPQDILHPDCWDAVELCELLAPAQALIDEHIAQINSELDAPAP